MATFTVPATDIYTDSVTGGRYRYFENDVIDLSLAVRLGMPGAALPAATTPFPAVEQAWLSSTLEGEGDFAASDHTHTSVSESRTATADGTGTGQITAGSEFVTVTSANAAHIVTLPTPTPSTVVTLRNGATGYELRTSAPATVAINGGTGEAAESAIPANTRVICHCDTATTWLCHETTTAGVVDATEVAAP